MAMHHGSTIAVMSAFIAVASQPAAAAPLAPSKPSQIVTAAIVSAGTACPDGVGNHFAPTLQLNADARQSVFQIPPKSVFIVTSFDFNLNGTAGQYASVGIFAAAPGQAGGATALSGAVVDPATRAVGTAAVPTGLVVKPPATVCAEFGNATGVVYVHGYFTKDK
jgi:hypothetical protein